MANIFWLSNTGNPCGNDNNLIDALVADGNNVTVGTDADGVSGRPPDIDTYDMAFISECSAGSGAQGDAWKDVAIPVINYHPYPLDEMEESASHGDLDNQDTITIIDNSSPIAAGFPLGDLVVTDSLQTFSSEPTQGPDFQLVAQASDGTNMVGFYESGSEGLNGFIMPAKRGYFAVRRNAQNVANANWHAIQQGFVNWVMGTTPPPATNVSVYDGADFVLAIPSVWDGAAWVPVTAKTWDGSQWT